MCSLGPNEAKNQIFVNLRSATSLVCVPASFNGLRPVAALAEDYRNRFSHFFWNIPPGNQFDSGAEYISIVLSILKKRCGMDGAKCALKIISVLEICNDI
jgi:hypothetical protein